MKNQFIRFDLPTKNAWSWNGNVTQKRKGTSQNKMDLAKRLVLISDLYGLVMTADWQSKVCYNRKQLEVRLKKY